ncbi:MAG: phasin family protein [Planctomycetes bacterium]|nr:phasin family protein [Planctomycetota bacterium]
MNKETVNGTSKTWTGQLRRIVLAGVGAVAVAQEEYETFISRLVAKGEIAEKDGKQLLADLLSRQKKAAKDGAGKLTGALDNRIERIFHKMHIPTKSDVATLAQRIEELNEKLDKLVKKSAAK